MSRLSKNTTILSLIALFFLIIGCGSTAPGTNGTPSETPCDKQSSIKGTIITISRPSSTSTSNILGGFLLDGSKEQKAEFDKVNVSVKTNTQIFEKQQQTCRAVGFTTLKVGQRVQLQSTGTVLQSYPPQIDATEIVILPLTSSAPTE